MLHLSRNLVCCGTTCNPLPAEASWVCLLYSSFRRQKGSPVLQCVWLGMGSAMTSPSLPLCAYGCWGLMNQIRVVVMGAGCDKGKEVMHKAC